MPHLFERDRRVIVEQRTKLNDVRRREAAEAREDDKNQRDRLRAIIAEEMEVRHGMNAAPPQDSSDRSGRLDDCV